MNTLKISQAHGNKICSSRIGRLFDYQILNSLGFELVSIYFCLAPLVKAKAKPSHRTRCEGDTVQSTIVREWIQGDMEDWAVNHLCHSNRASGPLSSHSGLPSEGQSFFPRALEWRPRNFSGFIELTINNLWNGHSIHEVLLWQNFELTT